MRKYGAHADLRLQRASMKYITAQMKWGLFSKTNNKHCSKQSRAAYRHHTIISNRTYAKRLLHPWMESEVNRELLLGEMRAKKKTEKKRNFNSL